MGPVEYDSITVALNLGRPDTYGSVGKTPTMIVCPCFSREACEVGHTFGHFGGVALGGCSGPILPHRARWALFLSRSAFKHNQNPTTTHNPSVGRMDCALLANRSATWPPETPLGVWAQHARWPHGVASHWHGACRRAFKHHRCPHACTTHACVAWIAPMVNSKCERH